MPKSKKFGILSKLLNCISPFVWNITNKITSLYCIIKKIIEVIINVMKYLDFVDLINIREYIKKAGLKKNPITIINKEINFFLLVMSKTSKKIIIVSLSMCAA